MRTFSTVSLSFIAQPTTSVYTDGLAAPGELDGQQLLFVVFLECGRDGSEEFWLVGGQIFDVYVVLAWVIALERVHWYLQ